MRSTCAPSRTARGGITRPANSKGAVDERIPDYNQVTYYATHNYGDDRVKDRFARRVVALIGFAKKTVFGALWSS